MATSPRPRPARATRAAPADQHVPPAQRAPDAHSAPDARALLDALRAVARELRRAEGREDPILGLQPAQRHALRELTARPAASLAELAARTHTDPSSASVVVQRLVERGFVSRGEAGEDRRRTVLTATAAGRALAAASPAGAVARVQNALEQQQLGERRTASLAAGLQTLARGLRGRHDGAAQDAAAPAPAAPRRGPARSAPAARSRA